MVYLYNGKVVAAPLAMLDAMVLLAFYTRY
jgi:hypothetical protein